MAPWGGCLARSPQCVCRMAFCGRGLSRSTASLAAVLPQLWLTLQALPAGSFSDLQRGQSASSIPAHTRAHTILHASQHMCAQGASSVPAHTHTSTYSASSSTHLHVCTHGVRKAFAQALDPSAPSSWFLVMLCLYEYTGKSPNFWKKYFSTLVPLV